MTNQKSYTDRDHDHRDTFARPLSQPSVVRSMLETGDKSRVRILAWSASDKIFEMLRNLNVKHNFYNLWRMIYILDHPSFFRAIVWTDKHHQTIPSGHYFSWVNYP
jgi:hypothetical protein